MVLNYSKSCKIYKQKYIGNFILKNYNLTLILLTKIYAHLVVKKYLKISNFVKITRISMFLI